MSHTNHNRKIESIVKRLKELTNDKKPLKFIHGSTNSTRTQTISDKFSYLDTSDLNEILEIDKEKMIAKVEPSVTMKKLVSETLKKGLIPKVVPEFPNITVGGAFQGAALESSSFKYGQVSDVISEIEVIDVKGNLITANRKKNSDLFYGMSGSYGTLGLVGSLKIELIKARPYVRIFIVPVPTSEVIKKLKEYSKNHHVEFLEAIVFSIKESAIIYGRLDIGVTGKEVNFSKPLSEWFYRFIQKHLKHNSVKNYFIKTEEYLFRYNYGAFWMGNQLFNLYHIPNNTLTRTILHRFEATKVMYAGIHKLNASHLFFIQDFYLKTDHVESFLKTLDRKLTIYPIWLCPLKGTTTEQFLSPHYLGDNLLIDVGVWGKIKTDDNEKILQLNRLLELEVYNLGGRQMLYADFFLSRKEMWKYYDYEKYKELKKKYDPDFKLSTVWDKTHSDPGDNKTKIIRGGLETLVETFKGKLD